MKKVQNGNYDIEGYSIYRLARLAFLGKIMPLGNWSSGPGLRCLAVLTVLHGLGHPLYWVRARYGERLSRLKRFLQRSIKA